jgi:aspartate 1-decarboxylase
MSREMLKSKIHRATVRQTDLHYVGSITVDQTLMELADILPAEKVDVVNINNGARFTTYVLPGERDSGVIGVNGASARLACPGDLVIILSYIALPTKKARGHLPSVVHVDANNRAILRNHDPASALSGSGLLRGDTGEVDDLTGIDQTVTHR